MATTITTTTLIPHADAARQLLDKIRGLRAEIPHFVLDDPASTQILGRIAAVSDEFIEAASVAVQFSQRLETAAGADAATLRDAYAYAIAYQQIVTELQALTRSMIHTIRVQRAAAVSSALDVYAHARRMVRQKDSADLIPYVNDMRRKLNGVTRPRTKPGEEPESGKPESGKKGSGATKDPLRAGRGASCIRKRRGVLRFAQDDTGAGRRFRAFCELDHARRVAGLRSSAPQRAASQNGGGAKRPRGSA